MAKLKSGTRVYGDFTVDSRLDLKDFTTIPTTPASDTLTLFAFDSAGKSMPAFIGSDGVDNTFQATIARNKVGFWSWAGNTTTVTDASWGLPAPSTSGNASTRNVATTRLFTSMRRIGYTTGTTTGTTAGVRSGVAQFWRGNAATLGGFYFIARFGFSNTIPVTAVRAFVGLSAVTGTPSNAEPNSSTYNNSVGVCKLSTSNNLHIMTRDGTAATTIDLGASFPANTIDTDMYQVILYSPPNGSSIGYRVTKLNTETSTSGTLTTNLPVNTTLLGIQQWINNNSSGSSYGIDFVSTYIETDY